MTKKDLIEILKRKIENAKADSQRRRRLHDDDDGEIFGEINAYNDVLTLVETHLED